MTAPRMGHNLGPSFALPYSMDSLATLAKKIRKASEDLKQAESTAQSKTLIMGQILLAARAKFGLPRKLRAGITLRERVQLAKFWAWSDAHSGVTKRTAKQYMSFALDPGRAAKRIDAAKALRRSRGVSQNGSAEHQRKTIIGLLRKMADADIRAIIVEAHAILQERSLRDAGGRV